jgi:PTS system fructose-specific IIA component
VAVVEPTLGFGRSAQGIDWGAADGPAHLIFLIAAPEGGGAEHMGILAKLARKLIHASFRDSLHQAQDPEAVVSIVKKEVLGQ